MRSFKWAFAVIAFVYHIFGIWSIFQFVSGALFFILGTVCIIYAQRIDLDEFFQRSSIKNPLDYSRHSLNLKSSQYGKHINNIDLRKSKDAKFCNNKSVDRHIDLMIDYVVRDFIEPWFHSLSSNKDFVEYHARACIEECVANICMRLTNTQWMPLITTRFFENVANHTRLYRMASESINSKDPNIQLTGRTISPQRRSKKSQHKRNKSDTDLDWYFDSRASQKTVANSKFYVTFLNEKLLTYPETNLHIAFFDQCSMYSDEAQSEVQLERYLTRVMETILYFNLADEDFSCIPLRTFLSILLANAVLMPILNLISDPDFININVAKRLSRESLSAEYFIRTIRQSTDLSELRACRQIITKHLNVKQKDQTIKAEVSSLKYIEKLVDLKINSIQNDDKTGRYIDSCDTFTNLPLLSLDDLLSKELAQYCFLDYLSTLNLQKYVLFYRKASGWKLMANQYLTDSRVKSKLDREEILKLLREKAVEIFDEYLNKSSVNSLDIDAGLIEALSLKIRDLSITPDEQWFDSVCKFVYEKLKNEDIFVHKFYESAAYKRLLLELEFISNNEHEVDGSQHCDSESDYSSYDLNLDDEEKLPNASVKTAKIPEKEISRGVPKTLKHSRSYSDCSEVIQCESEWVDCTKQIRNDSAKYENQPVHELQARENVLPTLNPSVPYLKCKDFLTAEIINTAILFEGQYAVYAIQVVVVENGERESWHIYRRYSKFLELKKSLMKKCPSVSKIAFPAKKTFHNTQRSVLEHRMLILNNFLLIICKWTQNDNSVKQIVRQFLEPDNDDRKLHGDTVIKTIETLVNPLKTGMRSIRNMPDALAGNFCRFLLGKGPLRDSSFLEISYLEESCEYPALAAALRLLDEVFDLQTRSQWLRRGIINRVLGAPWISHAANKKILHSAKSIIETDQMDNYLTTVLYNIWPEGKSFRHGNLREDSTKLRTRIAARMTLLSLLSDDFKHVVGSETTRSGLSNLYTMWQQKTLNLRLALIFFNDILKAMCRLENLTKHAET